MLLFGLWCGIAPTVWAVVASIAAQPGGPEDLFYVAIGALLLLRIVRAARSPVSIEESNPVSQSLVLPRRPLPREPHPSSVENP